MLSRTLLRRPLPSSLPASPAQLSLARLRLPAAHPYAALSARYAAGQVSNKPGAEDFSHAVTNIKEELGGVGDAAATAIAGHGQLKEDGSLSGDYKSVTTAMIEAVPPHVMQWGLAGGLPYVASALSTAYYSHSAVTLKGLGQDPSSALEILATVQSFQITYGAVMLSFLGAIHWGLEFGKFGGSHGHPRLALGVLPLAYAWPTLYLLNPTTALVAQWAGFLASWGLDRWAGSNGWAPKWYSTYRFYLTSLAGGSILFSLFALNQWDVTSPNLLSPTGGRNKPTIPTSGDSKIKMKASELAEVGIKVTPGGKDDGFLAIEKVDTPAEKKEKEEQAKKEEEEKKAREAEEKKAKKDGEDKKEGKGEEKEGGGGGGGKDDKSKPEVGDKAKGESKQTEGQVEDGAEGRSEKQDAKREEKAGGEATPKKSG